MPDAAFDLCLDLIAVSPGGLTSSMLVQALTHRKLTVDGRRPNTATLVDGLTALLGSHGLERDGRWFIAPEPAEQRMRRLEATKDIAEVVALADHIDPPHGTRSWDRRLRRDAGQRVLRTALRSGDDDLLRACADLLDDYDVRTAWHAPFPAARFAGMSALGQTVVGQRLFAACDALCEPLPRGAEACVEAARGVIAAELALRRGDRVRARALLADHEGFLSGFLYLLDGDTKASTKAYAAALASLRKAQGTEAIPPGLPGLFLPIAYLLHGTKGRRKQAMTLIDRTVFRSHFDDALAGWQNLRALEDPQWELMPVAHPFAVVLEVLVRRWRNDELPADRMSEARAQLKQMGHDLLAQELGEGSSLLALREVREAWRDTLAQLEQALGGVAVDATPDRRLAFELQRIGNEPHLEVREQLRRKGSWTKGRKVALERIHGARDPSLPWTDADRTLAMALDTYTQRRSWRYSETVYHWKPGPTWAAMVGHPHIFDPHGHPVRVVARSPRLVVEETGGRMRVRLEPDLPPGGVHVEPVGTGYEITTVDPEQQDVARMLAGGLDFPAKARARLEPVLAQLTGRFDPADDDVTREAPTDVGVWVRPHGTTLRMELGVQPLGPDGPRFVPGRGEPVLLDSDGGQGVRVVRDHVAEKARASALLALIEEEAELPEHIFDSLDAGLAFLAEARDAGVSLYWPEGGELVVRRPKEVAVAIRASGEWLEAGGSLDLGDRVLQLVDLLHGSVGQGRFLRLDDGSFLALEEQLRRKLDAVRRLADDRGRIHSLAAGVVRGLAEEEGVQITPEADALIARVDAPFSAPEVPSVLRADLRPYQADAYRWLCGLAHLGVGGILADDMGLGKTLTTLAFLLHRRADGPALVVAPTSVAGNWMREARRFAPDLNLHRLGDAAFPDTLGPGDVVIASYGLLVARRARLEEKAWHTLVFDESQALKNPDTQRHQAAAALPGSVRICLTGTPIENRLDELHAQLALVAPDLLPPRRRFRDRFSGPIERDDRDARRLLQRVVSPFLLRRTKEAVLDELPPRIDNELLVELSDAERAVYEAQRRAAVAAVDEGRGAIEVLAHLTRLRRIACSAGLESDRFRGDSAKLRAFRRLARDLVDNGHRALVFSQFLDHLALLRGVLEDEGLGYLSLDGSTPARQRDGLVQQFQTTDVPFFLISLKAGGTGLNLTGADYVLHMDPWWNPAVEDQASDRAHRIGQARPVTVYRVVAKDTVEEQILALHRTKRDLADQILEGQEKVTRLGVDELRALLRDG